MKVLSTDGLTELISLIKSAFISVNDTVSASVQTLATVATTGDYDDLTNKPTIPAAQVQSDWNETDTSSKAYIQNKPNIPSGVIVDQTYDGTSANAQSGVAIEGAGFVKLDGGSAQQTISLSSGTGTTALGLKSRSTTSYLSFSSSSGWLGSYGVSSAKKPTFYNGTGYTLAYTSDIPTNVSSFTNDSGYITGIGSSDVTTALGYTPADTTLSNLGATSSTNFDGQWVANKITALDAKTAGTTSYDLDNYLPSDYTTTPYLVYGILNLSTNEVQDVTVKRSTTSDEYSVQVFCVSNSRRATTTFIMPMGYVDGALYRYIYKVQNGGTATYGSSVQLLAYRRIGTNT